MRGKSRDVARISGAGKFSHTDGSVSARNPGNVPRFPSSWRAAVGEELHKPYFRRLVTFVAEQRREFPDQIFPDAPQVFAAFDATPFESVRVVLLGQDPYPTRGMAHGLCFSVDPGVRKLPTSLRNIFRERESDLGLAIPPTGCLLPWAAQGVLMLNTILTVREGRPLSHASRGWETFTDAVIKEVSERRDFVVFVLWGKAAQSKQPLIAPRHARVTAAHPSPLSARGFFGSSPFSTVNRLLRDAGKPVVDWTLR